VTKEERWEKRFELPVMIAAILVIPVIVIEQANPSHSWRVLGATLNWAIWIVFAAEAVTLLAISRNHLAWVREHPLEVAIVLLTPPFLPSALQAARLFRLLRLLRLLRLAKLGRRFFSLDGLRWAGVVALLTALGGGAAFASVESTGDKSVPTWDGVWWAISTMTTVGYGDLYPHTNLGRMIAVLVMVVGIGFGSLIIAAVAQRFVETEIRGETRAIEADVSLAESELIGEIREIRTRLERLEATLRAART
jgi:voltage-gated potassium channel